MKEISGDESGREILSLSAPGPARTGALGEGGTPYLAPLPQSPPHPSAPTSPAWPPVVPNLLISSLNLFMAGLYPFVYVPTPFLSLNSSFPSIIFPPLPVFQRAQSYLFSSCSGKKNLNYLTLGTLAGLTGCRETNLLCSCAGSLPELGNFGRVLLQLRGEIEALGDQDQGLGFALLVGFALQGLHLQVPLILEGFFPLHMKIQEVKTWEANVFPAWRCHPAWPGVGTQGLGNARGASPAQRFRFWTISL